MTGDQHVYPVADLREHDTSTRRCWCGPRIEDADGVLDDGQGVRVIVHHSMDGREAFETGERLVS